MAASGGRIANLVPNLTTLETSRSIRRLLVSPEDSRSPSPELPVSSTTTTRSKSTGDDCSFLGTARITWFACLVSVTLIAVIILGTHPLSDDWKSLSLSSGAAPLSSSPSGDKDALLVSAGHHGQDDWFLKKKNIATPASTVVNSGGGASEDEKCWSRTGHLRYRRTERLFPPSPRLKQALDEYASLHGRCTAGKNWDNFFTDMTAQSSVDVEESPCKYLMYVEGPEGLGNRFMSLVSAFAYALITDRVLLLDSRRNMSGLICEPFQGSSWTLPSTFPFEQVDGLPTLDDGVYENLERMAAVRLNLRHLQSQRDQSFFCGDVQERLGKVPWIAWNSNQYYLTRLFTMPASWEKLNPLFDDPSRAFTQLSRFLLLPQNAIWARTERIYRAYLASSRKLVGIQVRSPHFSTFQKRIQERLMQCLLDDLILPKISERSRDARVFNENAEEEGTTIFVASLQREYYEGLKEIYAERGTEDGSLVTVHTMAAEGQENDSYDQSVKALVDMWLLSFSDSLVTSGWSTFGYVAQGLGAVYPYVINTDVEQASSCYAGQSVEPCTHFPFLSSCSATSDNVSEEHWEWTKTHIRVCQDEPRGLQLVHD